ncbi:hypothetical protein T440DRAFT_170902 [Plenodomus tracheiphilus IPT5]|uniref:Uncharacterized protein n=1 Tax=Plenodomus tracheiphilus IPT5 TaxID=1408161 RepID=A0A6A7AZA1_9PLEO|nr:hypothetical protein T440DRAFT_170902 [Plenodomus tracheiphilus IPT5]
MVAGQGSESEDRHCMAQPNDSFLNSLEIPDPFSCTHICSLQITRLQSKLNMAQPDHADHAVVDVGTISPRDNDTANGHTHLTEDDALIELDIRARGPYNQALGLTNKDRLQTQHRHNLLQRRSRQPASSTLRPPTRTLPTRLQRGTYTLAFTPQPVAHGFAAKQGPESIQSLFRTRLIWYYGIDATRSFSDAHPNMRYNILTIVYLWACDFPITYVHLGQKRC